MVNTRLLFRLAGIVGSLACLVIFALHPSFPTPDKLFVFFVFVFAAFSQAWQMTKRILPFVAVILAYESFRSFADQLNKHVNYSFAPHVDKFLFGSLPTASLQQAWWHGTVHWFDVVLYVPYLLFFFVPMALAVLIWKTRDKYYWQTVCSFCLLFFMAFVTFLIFPAAPPWLASQSHVIEPITRISSHVWSSLGIQNFPSVYNRLSPNSVAAVPSLHAGVSILASAFIFKLYGRKWGVLSLIYPLVLCLGVIYEGEHYFSDVLIGAAYAGVAYIAGSYLNNYLQRVLTWFVTEATAKRKYFR